MTLGAYIDADVFTQRRLGFDDIAAAAGSLHWPVGWMDFRFHVISSQLMSPHRIQTESMHHICFFLLAPGAAVSPDLGT